MFAAVDLGSNSFRLHIGECDGKKMRIIKSARDPIRLAAGLDRDGMLTKQAMQTALDCLANFADILRQYPLTGARVVATNTLRVARNANTFIPAAEKAIGYPIEVISGEEEGRLIYMGVATALADPNERRLVIDIGGGSTEIIRGQGTRIDVVESFSIGTHRQSSSFFASGGIDEHSFEAAILSSRSYFEDGATLYDPQHWSVAYGSSGTIRAISEVISRNGIGDGTMSYDSLLALKDRLVEFGHVDRFDLPGVKPERVTAMIGGLAILLGIMQELGVHGLTAVNAGLRLGVLYDLQLRVDRHDRRDQAVLECMRRFNVDESRAIRTADIAARLYEKLKPESEAYSKHLAWSCMLHEVGLTISHTGGHKHSAYIIEHADLSGFTTREQRIMSTLVVGHKGNLRKIRDALTEPDIAKAILAMRLATMFMHSKIDAEIDELALHMKSRIEIEVKRDWIKRHPTLACWLEKERDCWADIDVAMSIKSI